MSAEYLELTSALKSKDHGKNTSMPSGSNAKGSDHAKQKSGTNTSMRTESNVKGSDDPKQKSMTYFNIATCLTGCVNNCLITFNRYIFVLVIHFQIELLCVVIVDGQVLRGVGVVQPRKQVIKV